MHWNAVQRIFRYLNGTKHHGIHYDGNEASHNEIIGFVDANWGADQSLECKSTSGYVYFVFGGPVVWSSKRQTTVALSTCEAEYVAASEAVSHGMWILQFLQELFIRSPQSHFVLHCDNQSAIQAASNPVHHGRMKHINLRHHFIRDALHQGKVIVKYVPTKINVADALTKALALPLFKQHSQILVYDIEEGC